MKRKTILIILIFLISFLTRVSTLNDMGRTWDESTYVSWGHNLVNLVKKGDFQNQYWYANPGFPPVSRYLYGAASYFDVFKYDQSGTPIFNYDLTFSRLISVILTSLTAVMIFLIGYKYLSEMVGILSGIIFSFLPLSVAYGQIATLESHILFFFTGTIYWLINYFKNNLNKNLIITGIFLGLAIGSKYTNILLFPLIIILYLLFVKLNKKHSYKWVIKNIFKIFVISFLTFFVIWPMPFFHIKEVIEYNYSLRFALNKYPSIEVFYGKLIHLPVYYFFIMFLITTPIFTLLSFFLGAKRISDLSKNKSKQFFLYTLIIWFCFPFIQSFYNLRVQGIRYIIEIYAPFSLIAAIGIDYASSLLGKNNIKKYFILFIFVLYQIIVLLRISPYFLDYYNFVVGGASNINQNRLFQVAWWGEGVKEAGLYIDNHANKGESVGLAIDPIESWPSTKNKLKTYKYTNEKLFNYVVITDFYVLRLGFDDSFVKKNYKLIYSVKADGASLVYVYKKK